MKLLVVEQDELKSRLGKKEGLEPHEKEFMRIFTERSFEDLKGGLVSKVVATNKKISSEEGRI